NKCVNCQAVNDDLAVDVQEIDAASNRGIDEIRDLREKVQFAPATGRFRVFIIDEVHMLTNEAFNALLKTLEEPPRHVVFILATTEPRKVLKTILSRCQRFDFRPIAENVIIDKLREVAVGAGIGIDEEALSVIARAAEGGLRDALSILDQASSLGEMQVSAENVHYILGTVQADVLERMAECLKNGDSGTALSIISELAGLGKDLRFFAQDLASFLRNIILRDIMPNSIRQDILENPENQSANNAGLLRAVDVLLKADQDMKWSNMPGIILELALVKICRPELTFDLTSLTARIEKLENKITQIAVPANSAVFSPASTPVIVDTGMEENAAEVLSTVIPKTLSDTDAPRKRKKPSAPDRQGIVGTSGSVVNERLLSGNPDGQPVVVEAEVIGRLEQPAVTDRKSLPGQSSTVVVPDKKGLLEQPALTVADAESDKATPADVTVIEQESTVAVQSNLSQELEQIRKTWPDIMDAMRRAKPSLYPAFLSAAPLDMVNGLLTVGFPEGEVVSLGMAERPANKEFFAGLLSKYSESSLQVNYTYYQGENPLPIAKPAPVSDISRRFSGEEVSTPDDHEDELRLLFDDE
ncbi:MAG: DNA polymerase III subunit gamma/tau, partial [Peptococcaceae bacterium]|nr:DNA polymerase III subunit gamma/tau [Peptococcaceae bacterium]